MTRSLVLPLSFAVAFAITAAIAFAVGASVRSETESPTRSIIEALTRQNPNPVNISPSGALVLIKSMHATDFELEVVRDGVVIARHRSSDTQLAPTWRFDDGAIAFLSDHDGDQQHRLFVLDIASGAVRRIDTAPPTATTALRWEPHGTRVAYLVATRERRERKLVVVDTASPSPPQIVLDGLSEHAGFVWSPDGASLASVSRASPG